MHSSLIIGIALLHLTGAAVLPRTETQDAQVTLQADAIQPLPHLFRHGLLGQETTGDLSVFTHDYPPYLWNMAWSERITSGETFSLEARDSRLWRLSILDAPLLRYQLARSTGHISRVSVELVRPVRRPQDSPSAGSLGSIVGSKETRIHDIVGTLYEQGWSKDDGSVHSLSSAKLSNGTEIPNGLYHIALRASRKKAGSDTRVESKWISPVFRIRRQ